MHVSHLIQHRSLRDIHTSSIYQKLSLATALETREHKLNHYKISRRITRLAKNFKILTISCAGEDSELPEPHTLLVGM